MDVDYDYDADPFADLDYDDLVKWAAEHRLDGFHFRWLNINTVFQVENFNHLNWN